MAAGVPILLEEPSEDELEEGGLSNLTWAPEGANNYHFKELASMGILRG